MQQAPMLYIIILGLSALLSTFLAAWARLHLRVSGARYFFPLMLCVSYYTLGYAFELTQVELSRVLTAIRLEYLGLAFIPTLMILFSINFTQDSPPPRWLETTLLAISAVVFLIVFTLDYHNLFYINPRIVESPYFMVLQFDRGILYLVNYAYTMLTGISSVILISIHAALSQSKRKRQAITISIGAAIPVAVSMIYFIEFPPGSLDPVPLALTVSGVILWFALFRLGLFELVPAAREQALDSIHEAFLVTDMADRLQDLNQAALNIPGASDLVIGNPLPWDNPLIQQLRPLLKSDKDRVDFYSGKKVYNARSYAIMNNPPRVEGLAILIHDITENVELVEQLHQQASTDELTGLLNRRQLFHNGEQAMLQSSTKGSPLGLIMIDIDHFKQINDTYGHAAGDKFLKLVARQLQDGLRESDILGRYGGEEFAIILPGTDLTRTIHTAERLRQQISERTMDIHGEQVQISASFGVYAEIPDEHTSIGILLNAADMALYQAKGLGRNQVVVLPDQQVQRQTEQGDTGSQGEE